MKDNRFEQMWREALQNASETPPLKVWKLIDKKIDQDNSFDGIIASKFADASIEVPSSVWDTVDEKLNSEELVLENEFSFVFESLEIAPPSFVWANIEAGLEEDDRKPIIVFWQNRWLAGSIAAMLIMLLSIPLLTNWFDKSNGDVSVKNTIPIISSSKIKDIGASTREDVTPEISEIQEGYTEEPLALSRNNFSSSSKAFVGKTNSVVSPFFNSSDGNLSDNLEQAKSQGTEETMLASIFAKAKGRLEKLQSKAFSPYGSSYTLKRVKLALPYSEEEEIEFEKAKSKSWLGFMSGLAPFDPNISITNFERQALVSAGNVPTSFFEYKSVVETPGVANANDVFEIPLSQPFNDIRTGSAINLGLDYGFKMAKNFSFQTGMRYTRGSSFIQSNVYSYNPSTGNVSTFIESHYLTNENSSRNNTLISSAEDVKNAYQFLMVPLQLGYHLPIFDKMEIAANAGVSGDFLINNVLDETPEGGSKLTPGNSAYKGFNMSGIGGLKLNYQVNNNWDASVGANYQQALQSGVDATQSFSFRPKFFGVSYGINYKLN